MPPSRRARGVPRAIGRRSAATAAAGTYSRSDRCALVAIQMSWSPSDDPRLIVPENTSVLPSCEIAASSSPPPPRCCRRSLDHRDETSAGSVGGHCGTGLRSVPVGRDHCVSCRAMREAYLEVTYRHGEPLAAYFYLPRRGRRRVVRTRRVDPGLIIDFAADGQPLGIEITAPGLLTLASLNRVLRQLGCAPARRADLAPLRAA
jgi:hypothetical protein